MILDSYFRRHSCRLLLALTTAWAATPVSGQSGTATALDPFITTGTRTPAEARTLGSVVDSISVAELARRQIASLAGSLNGTAGTPLFASGAGGATTSLFLRGANSNQTLFLVDGLRLNDPNTNYEVFLGGACVSACDSLEVAHGPQSTLYGGEAIGGVVALRAQRGTGQPSGRVSFEAGSYGTVQGAVSGQGERGQTAWNFSAQGGHTDNERRNNSFDSANVTLRLDQRVSARLNVGGTLRWFHGIYGDPGDRYTNDPDNESHESNLLATSFATVALAPAWTAHIVLGGQDRRFVSENPRPGASTQVTVVKNRRGVLDAQSTYSGWGRHRATAGLTAEANHTRNTGFGSINEKQTLLAVFAQDEFSPRDDLFLTAGLRNDDFDTFGRATTGRATAAWLIARRALKFRSSFGTAFRSPSFLDLYGQSAFYRGNPNLKPERARGWDAGLDYYFDAGRGTLGVTWFETRFRDLIASTANFRSVENIQQARTRGAEVTAKYTMGRGFDLRAHYTYLEAENLTSGRRLLRRPRHRSGVDIGYDFARGLFAGIGIAMTADREDVHARTFRTVDHEDYTVVRLYSSWQLSKRLTVKARVENVLNERYEEVNGYPALGLGAFAGAEWRW